MVMELGCSDDVDDGDNLVEVVYGCYSDKK
jgi:hypothetical protein